MLEVVLSTPAMLRIFIVFVAVLASLRLRLPLWLSFFSGALLLGVLFGMAPMALAASIVDSMTRPKTISLSAVVCLILVLSISLEKSGQMKHLLGHFQGLISNSNVNLIMFPALIGLLPMPGGAVFSAPMVRVIGDRLSISKDRLNFINYWFRHIWEYWWPLYPGVLLTTALSGIDLWTFVLFLSPLTLAALGLGYGVLRRWTGPVTPLDDGGRSRPSVGPFVRELLPILIVVVGGLGAGQLLSMLFGASVSVTKELGLIAALAAAIVWVWKSNRMPSPECRSTVFTPQLLRMFGMVSAIFIFNGVLEDSRAVKIVSQELVRWNIPLAPITVVLPFLVGGVVGLTIAFVGTTFPILISLVQAMGNAELLPAYMMLAMVSGFVGVLVSPLHLCLLLSSEYFQTRFGPVYRYMAIPCGGLLLSAIVYFAILRYFL
jgi:integral membrane protein (TIGR00529 family)